MSEETTPTYAIIAGGGTAGHVSPGIAIAEALVSAGHDPAAIHYVGSARGIERDMVPKAGFALTVLPGRGIERKLTLRNVSAIAGLIKATFQAFFLVRRLRPKVIVSLGGYASVPCAFAARLLKVPVVIAEQNAVPGAANKVVGRWAKACAISFPGTDLPRAVLTGNPVRPEMRGINRLEQHAAARGRLNIPQGRRLVTVYGGSLGARRINKSVVEAVVSWNERHDLVVRHLIGARDWDVIDRPPETAMYVPVKYEADMATVLTASELVVCRAGASSVAELAAVAVPSVLVPLPGAPGDHQTANAQAMVDAGGAVLVADGDLTASVFVELVDELLADTEGLEAMAMGAASVARLDAADQVAALVMEHARD